MRTALGYLFLSLHAADDDATDEGFLEEGIDDQNRDDGDHGDRHTYAERRDLV